ncbi:hypothetical protein BGW39_006906 [Mortierella sp. 14UC]|nr:hypothetical protein BGW39_006906 [Mortierella sp. 14UC]
MSPAALPSPDNAMAVVVGNRTRMLTGLKVCKVTPMVLEMRPPRGPSMPVIKPNSSIPIKKSMILTSKSKYQAGILIKIFERLLGIDEDYWMDLGSLHPIQDKIDVWSYAHSIKNLSEDEIIGSKV